MRSGFYLASSRAIKANLALSAMAAVSAVPIALLVSLVPRPLVLPVFSCVAVAGAGLLLLVAWWNGARRDTDRVTAWDVSGALALVGFAAALLSDPASVLQELGHSLPDR